MQIGRRAETGYPVIIIEDGEVVSVKEMLDFAVANQVISAEDCLLRFGNTGTAKVGIWFQFDPNSAPAHYWVDYLVKFLVTQGVQMKAEGFFLPEQSFQQDCLML